MRLAVVSTGPIQSGGTNGQCDGSYAFDWNAFAQQIAQHGIAEASDLAGIMRAWPTLPEAVKAGIMAMVRAATPVD